MAGKSVSELNIEAQVADIRDQMRLLAEDYRSQLAVLSEKEVDLLKALEYAKPASVKVQTILDDAKKP